jgi:hypothetical protein
VGNRGVLLLVVIGLALVAAGWFAAGSPAKTAGETAVPAQIVVNATQTGTGTWVRYVIDVRNVGDLAFDGNAILLNREPDAESSTGGVPKIPPPQLPVTIPRFPASAPDAAYQVPIHLEPRQERTFSVVAPDRYTEVAIAQQADGSYVAGGAVDRRAYIPIAVLTQSDAAAAGIQGLRFDDASLRVTSYTDAKLFPATALGLAGYTAVVIDQFDVRSLSATQIQALRDFVGQGGGLVVAGGDSWRRTLAPLPAELSPLHPVGVATASLAPVAALAQSGESGSGPVATGDLRAGSRTVLASSAPLAVEGVYGSGTVVDLAFDPAASPSGSDLLRLGWTESIGRVLVHAQGTGAATVTIPGVSQLEAGALPPLREAGLPSPWLVLPLLLAYLVMVAPVNYFLLRKRRRQDFLWITAPIVAILFTGGFYWLGTDLQGSLHDEQLQILKLGPNGSVADLEYHRVVFLQRGSHILDTATPALAAPLTFDLSGSGSAGCGDRCSLELAGLPSGEEHVVPAQRPAILEKGVVYGGVRVVGTATESHHPIAVETHLSVAGGKIVGEIDNTGQTTLRGIALYSTDGGAYRRTPLASLIPAGTKAMVSGTPDPFDGDPNSPIAGSKAPPDVATRISQAVGADALSRSPSAWLVGFTDPVPSSLRVDGAPPQSQAVSVFEMPVTMESADAAPGDWSVRRLAATAGDRARGGLSDVYDIELPARLTGKLSLGYDTYLYSSVDVFDWSSNSWRSGGFIDDPTSTGRRIAPLSAGDIVSGDGWNLLRVRVGEARLNWGSSLFVTAR